MARNAKAKPKPKPSAPRARSALNFKRRDVVRAIRAAKDAELPIGRIEIDRSGCIIITPKADAPQPGNSWDDVTNAQDSKRSA
jgi:hypothetical protein